MLSTRSLPSNKAAILPPRCSLVLELLHLVRDRDGRVAHDIEILLDLEDLIEARIDAGEELGLVAGFAADAAVVFKLQLHMLAARRGEFPILGGLRLRIGRGRALHAVGGGQLVDPERSGRLLGIAGQPVDEHLGDRCGGGLLDRDGEIDHLAGSDRRAVRRRDVDAVDEDHAQIGVLGGALGRDGGLGAGRQHRLESRIRNLEVELHAGFRALLQQGLRIRRPHQAARRAAAASTAARAVAKCIAADILSFITRLPFLA